MHKQIKSTKARGQIAALDGVRGVAILLVFCIHLQQTGVVPPKFRVINVLMHSGWSGVDLFFVLSGFLITLGLLESRESANYFSAFYMRRVLRIFPLYYFALAAGMIGSVFLANYSPDLALLGDNTNGPLFPSWPGWISHVLYLENWWMPWKEPASRSIFGHFWSLAIEEQFYLVWPLCVWLLPRKRLLVLCIAVCAGVPALRFFLIGHYHVAPEIIFRNTVTRADTLMAGALCAMVARDRSWFAHVRRWFPVMTVLGAAYLITVAIAVPEPTAQVYYADTLGFTALALIFGPLVMWAYFFNGRLNWFDRLFSLRPLTNLGKYSYGLYVYHIPVIILAKIMFGTSPWFGHEILRGLLFCVASVVCAVCLAVASYELFEKRFLYLKRYFEPRYSHSPEREVNSSQTGNAAPSASSLVPLP